MDKDVEERISNNITNRIIWFGSLFLFAEPGAEAIIKFLEKVHIMDIIFKATDYLQAFGLPEPLPLAIPFIICAVIIGIPVQFIFERCQKLYQSLS